MNRKRKLNVPEPVRSDNSEDVLDIYTDQKDNVDVIKSTTAVGDALSDDERQTLEECKLIIARGMQTFTEVGNALMTIRNQKLYRETHGTFENYMQEEFGLQRRRAYQLMEAAEVVEQINRIELSVSQPQQAAADDSSKAKLTSESINQDRAVSTPEPAVEPTESAEADQPASAPDLLESQARAMSGLTDPQMNDVWQQVQEERGDTRKHVPAKRIKEMADTAKGKPPKRPTSKKKVDTDESDDADAEWLAPAADQKPAFQSLSSLSSKNETEGEDGEQTAHEGEADPTESAYEATASGDEPGASQAVKEQIRRAVSRASGMDVSVTVLGGWLIREGLSDQWHQLRSRDAESEDKITEEYRDVLFADEARQLGLL